MALDLAKIKKKALDIALAATQKGGKKSRVRYMKMAGGSNRIRIMPPFTDTGPSAGLFYREVHTHWGVGGDGTKDNPGMRFACPKKTPGSPSTECPICDEASNLFKTRDPVDFQKAKDLRAREGYLSNVVDMDDPVFTKDDVTEFKNNNAGAEVPFKVGNTKVKVWNYGPTMSKDLIDYISNWSIDITDFNDGRELVVGRVGTGKEDTRYSASFAPMSTKFEFKGDLATSLYNLDELSPFSEYEKMKEALLGGDSFSPLAFPSKSGRTSSVTAKTINPFVDDDFPPVCYKDPAVHSDKDAECTGGTKKGEHFDKCVWFDSCRDAIAAKQAKTLTGVDKLEEDLRAALG